MYSSIFEYHDLGNDFVVEIASFVDSNTHQCRTGNHNYVWGFFMSEIQVSH